MSGCDLSVAESSRGTEGAKTCSCSCKDELEALKARLARLERQVNPFGCHQEERPTLRVEPIRRAKRRAEEQDQSEGPNQRRQNLGDRRHHETSNNGDDVVDVDLTSGDNVAVDGVATGPVVLPTALDPTSDELVFCDAVEYRDRESTVVIGNVRVGPTVVSILFLKECFVDSSLDFKARITCFDDIGQFVVKGITITGGHSCACCNQVQQFRMFLSHAETGVHMLALPFNVDQELVAAISRPAVSSIPIGYMSYRWTRIGGRLVQGAILPECTSKIVQVARAGLSRWSRRYANYVPLVKLDNVRLRP